MQHARKEEKFSKQKDSFSFPQPQQVQRTFLAFGYRKYGSITMMPQLSDHLGFPVRVNSPRLQLTSTFPNSKEQNQNQRQKATFKRKATKHSSNEQNEH